MRKEHRSDPVAKQMHPTLTNFEIAAVAFAVDFSIPFPFLLVLVVRDASVVLHHLDLGAFVVVVLTFSSLFVAMVVCPVPIPAATTTDDEWVVVVVSRAVSSTGGDHPPVVVATTVVDE